MQQLFTDFFLWCSGSDPDILNRCDETERKKHNGFGRLILIPTIIGLISMTYASTLIIDSIFVNVSIGMIWAMMIFWIDRFLVSNLNVNKSQTQLWYTNAVVRIVFAIFLGIIVAHPVILRIFQETIDDKLESREVTDVSAIREKYANQREEEDNKLIPYDTKLEELSDSLAVQQRLLQLEIDGVESGETTGRAGDGKSADEKRQHRDFLKKRIREVNKERTKKYNEIQRNKAQININEQRELDSFREPRDYSARATALAELEKENKTIRRTAWFLIIFFVLLDIIPVIFKLLTPPGMYETYQNKNRSSVPVISTNHPFIEFGKLDEEYYDAHIKTRSDEIKRIMKDGINYDGKIEDLNKLTEAKVALMNAKIERKSIMNQIPVGYGIGSNAIINRKKDLLEKYFGIVLNESAKKVIKVMFYILVAVIAFMRTGEFGVLGGVSLMFGLLQYLTSKEK